MDPLVAESEIRLKLDTLTRDDTRSLVLQAGDRSTLSAQQEVLDMTVAHLVEHYPLYYTFDKGIVRFQTEDMREPLNFRLASFASPLECAASLVQEDLVLVRWDPSESTYRIVAACVCFSFGNLLTRVGQTQTMREIHRNVHGYGDDLARPVDRMMKAIDVHRPVWRVNWALTWSGDLLPSAARYPVGDVESHQRSDPQSTVDVSKTGMIDDEGGSGSDDDDDGVAPSLLDRLLKASGDERGVSDPTIGDSLHLKAEYQTLRRLPSVENSDYIVFSVRTYIDPLRTLEYPHPHGQPEVAAALASNIRSIAGMDFARFKGLDDAELRLCVLEYLDGLAAHAPRGAA
jgi:hypothetical protein